ncbi:hypothetical protein BA6E_10920 [Bacteroidales bacterium 6E]|nr:hypothetical protein BA6E_10920 [Bacteroidales bacterium 6E]
MLAAAIGKPPSACRIQYSKQNYWDLVCGAGCHLFVVKDAIFSLRLSAEKMASFKGGWGSLRWCVTIVSSLRESTEDAILSLHLSAERMASFKGGGVPYDGVL